MNSAATAEVSDGVEQLLQAAQDELLLKLSVDSYIKKIPAAPPPKLQQEEKEEEEKKERKSKVVVVDNIDEELRGLLGDDLSIRFAALKASFSSSSNPNPNPTPAATTTTNEVRIGLENSTAMMMRKMKLRK
ncbi:hypothetical protein CRYUN_Cryun04dG0089400 [Craigia yunnanensis]